MRKAARGRLLIVSHPSAVSVNQAIYVKLRELGWAIFLIVPDRWRHEFQQGHFRPEALPGIEDCLVRVRVILPGRPQRHVYVVRPTSMLRDLRPKVAFFEEECFSIPAFQWAIAATRTRTPFGVQVAENLDRALPLPARLIRSWVLRRAAFVAARSPTGGELARQWGAVGRVTLTPHAVPEWEPVPRRAVDEFTVGYAGRLVPEKGISDLIAASRFLDPPLRLLLVGDGPLRESIERTSLPNGRIEIRSDLAHDRMAEAYAEMDVLVLPSRTTPRWSEQFGRVLVEALWCGVPVVGSDSGEIPWVIDTTGGGRVFPEGDVRSLARTIADLRGSAQQREALSHRGRKSAQRLFSLDAATQALDDALLVAVAARSRDGLGERAANGSSRPRVALLAHDVHDNGGMERAFSEIVRQASDRYRFVVFSSTIAPEFLRLVEWRRIPVIRRPIPLKFMIYFIIAGRQLRRDSSFDLVHSLGAIVPNRVDVASVHFCHAGYDDSARRSPAVHRPLLRRLNTALSRILGFAAERWSYRPGRVRLLTAVSNGIEHELQRHYPDVPVALTPNGIDSQRFRPDLDVHEQLRRLEAVPSGDVVTLFVGGDWDHKGLGIALEGLAGAIGLTSRRLHLWVVGRGNEKRYLELARQLGVQEHVRFFGFSRQVERFYQAADIFVLPTLYESFSLAAYEAAASGLPVVATRVSGVDQLVGDGEAGILVDRNSEAVATALAQLASDSALRGQMGDVGLRRARACTWGRSVEAITKSYERLLAEARVRA
jgi:UDP-glucose:(heptosyl)LPS alpha-1,3-glucosyltransferase